MQKAWHSLAVGALSVFENMSRAAYFHNNFPFMLSRPPKISDICLIRRALPVSYYPLPSSPTQTSKKQQQQQQSTQKTTILCSLSKKSSTRINESDKDRVSFYIFDHNYYIKHWKGCRVQMAAVESDILWTRSHIRYHVHTQNLLVS